MAFDHSRDMMLLARTEPGVLLRVVTVNRTYVEALNRAGVAVTADELAGLTFDETAGRLGLDTESRRAVRARFEAAIRGGEAVEYDESTPVACGVFYGRTTLTPIPDAAGRCGHVLYSSRDVSAQRQAELALRTTRETTANLLGNLSGMAYRCRNDEHWTMEFVSEGVRELAGYAPEAVIGNRDISWEMIVHPEDRARIRDDFNRDARPGLRSEGTYRIVTADGREKWVIERALALGGADDGISHYEGIVTDITVLKHAELAVAEKERALSAILDHSFQFIGLMDAHGRMLRANRTALDAVGATEPEVAGKFFWDTPWWAGMPEEQAKLRDAVARVGRGEFVRFQTRHPGADGRVLHVDFSLKPVFGADGRVALMIPEGRDITEIRQAQEALRFSEEKFHRAFHGSPNIICISRLADGLMLEVNETFGREYGVPPELARGRTSMELGIWADEAERAEFVARLRRDGRVRDLFRAMEDYLRVSLRQVILMLTELERARQTLDAGAEERVRRVDLAAALRHTVGVLERTRRNFKSKELAELRRQIEWLLDGRAGDEPIASDDERRE